MKEYKSKTDKFYKLASSNSLETLKESIAEFYFRENANIVTINADGEISLLNKDGTTTIVNSVVKKITRKTKITSYVFLLPEK